jgi:hypothetical protein
LRPSIWSENWRPRSFGRSSRSRDEDVTVPPSASARFAGESSCG